MRSLRDWQRDAYTLAVEKGFHSRECSDCKGTGWDDGKVLKAARRDCDDCSKCNGTGRVPVDPRSPTRIAACLAAVHGEVSEAYECVARGGIYMELHWYDTKTKALITKECTPYQAFLTDPTKRAHFPEYKPEGFPIELADVFLRLCDLAESLGLTMVVPEPEPYHVSKTPEEIAAALCAMHDTLPSAAEMQAPDMHAFDFAGIGRLIDWRACRLNDFAHELFFVADLTGVDLLAMAELKHEFNKTRPIMHGGKVL